MNNFIKKKNKPQGAFSNDELINMQPPAPDNWLVVSIIALFICLPFGLLGLIRARRINYYYRRGFFTEAKLLSIETGRWLKIGIACGFIIYIIILSFYGAAIIKTLYS